MAGKAALEIEQGATFRQAIHWASGGQSVDLTGCSAVMQIRETFESELPLATLQSADGGITLDDAGNIALYLSAGDTAQLPAGKYVYDLEITLANGDIKRLLSGTVTVTREVTR